MKNGKILFILLIFAVPDLCGGGNPMTTSMLPQDGDKVTKKHCDDDWTNLQMKNQKPSNP